MARVGDGESGSNSWISTWLLNYPLPLRGEDTEPWRLCRLGEVGEGDTAGEFSSESVTLTQLRLGSFGAKAP
jgi:hypothetical protein